MKITNITEKHIKRLLSETLVINILKQIEIRTMIAQENSDYLLSPQAQFPLTIWEVESFWNARFYLLLHMKAIDKLRASLKRTVEFYVKGY